ncbi:MAG: hypothetical protein U9O96_01570 [Candidatus Thermoplasmatota archaeon]|nr:hypothetical protein [Candidatus Thermoplasmatota archaeon]
MSEKYFGEKRSSSRGMYMRSIADIPELYAISFIGGTEDVK